MTDAIIQQGILPLYFNPDETVSVDILKALYNAGIKAVEYTNRGEAALKNFTKMVQVRNESMPGLLLGVGTIKNLEQANDYMAAGADFLVSPGLVKEVAEFAASSVPSVLTVARVTILILLAWVTFPARSVTLFATVPDKPPWRGLVVPDP
ncbi:MAG: hypothetical protein EOO39_41475 [Cytophagaceae bacterium]|nr:MAG: hypothetical protein EOO39_41475 [Cytophagaceae bacterium]